MFSSYPRAQPFSLGHADFFLFGNSGTTWPELPDKISFFLLRALAKILLKPEKVLSLVMSEKASQIQEAYNKTTTKTMVVVLTANETQKKGLKLVVWGIAVAMLQFVYL